MTDPRVTKLAQTIVGYSAAVQPGDKIHLSGEVSGLPLLREIYRECLAAGGFPITHLTDETSVDYLLRQGTDAQLEFLSPLDVWRSEQADVSINVRASTNTRRLSSLDPQRDSVMMRARRGLSKIRGERTQANAHRWTLTQFPTEAYAQEADMSLEEYEDFVYHATFADQPDPVKCWNDLRDGQQKYVDWLVGRKDVVVRGPNIDLKLSIAGRTFVNSDGRRNMPSGEIFTGPVEDSVNGWVRFSYPALRSGRQVDGVELHFEAGKVIEASARKNQDFLLAQLDTDPGARFLGEFAIGTNYGINRFTGNILFDEKIGGTLHMAVGSGYPETGSKNQSAVHWDMICDMHEGEIVVDGDVLYKNGQFAF